MDAITPLRFEPIFKTALWGGRRLAELLPGAPADGPISEAWLVSDQDAHLSKVAGGTWAGRTLRDVLKDHAPAILGRHAGKFSRFPLLLKLIDAQQQLSVQVHPTDDKAKSLSNSDNGKTEAWFVLHAEPGSRIYSGLKPGADEAALKQAVAKGTIADCLHQFEPKAGDCVFLPAGIVHALGGGILLFELQQCCDITYRIFDWGRTDPKTGKPRELHVEQALAVADYASGPVAPIRNPPRSDVRSRLRELLIDCPYFQLWRNHAASPFRIEPGDTCRIFTGAEGLSYLIHEGEEYPLGVGQTVLIPATASSCVFIPSGRTTILECSIP